MKAADRLVMYQDALALALDQYPGATDRIEALRRKVRHWSEIVPTDLFGNPLKDEEHDTVE